MAYSNPSASNWNAVPMHELGDFLTEVGGFKLNTPVSKGHLLLSDEGLSEEVVWWWRMKKRVFESAAQRVAFGTDTPWTIVSQRHAHVLQAVPPPRRRMLSGYSLKASQEMRSVHVLTSQTRTRIRRRSHPQKDCTFRRKCRQRQQHPSPPPQPM